MPIDLPSSALRTPESTDRRLLGPSAVPQRPNMPDRNIYPEVHTGNTSAEGQSEAIIPRARRTDGHPHDNLCHLARALACLLMLPTPRWLIFSLSIRPSGPRLVLVCESRDPAC